MTAARRRNISDNVVEPLHNIEPEVVAELDREFRRTLDVTEHDRGCAVEVSRFSEVRPLLLYDGNYLVDGGRHLKAESLFIRDADGDV